MSAHSSSPKTQRAIALFQQGQIKEAKSLLENVCAKERKNELAWFMLATVNFQLGKLKEAEKAFTQATVIKPTYAEAWNNLGVVNEQLNHIEAAARCYRNAIKIKPTYTSAMFHFGNLCHKIKRNDEAEEFYRRVLKIDPNHLKSLNNLALILQQRKDYSEAMLLLDKALRNSPNDIEALNNVGYIHRAQGELEKAVEFFTRAISLQENSAKSLANLGVTQIDMGDTEQAFQSFRKALKVDPMSIEANVGMAQYYEEIGDFKEAAMQYEKVTRIAPDHAPGWNGLGINLTRIGEPQNAQDSFSKANRIDPTFSDTRFNLAVSQLAAGLYEQGFKNYSSRPSRISLNFPTSTSLLDKILDHKTILINKDQGLGDEIFFLRFTQEIKDRGARIFYRADNKLKNILSSVYCIDKIIDEDISVAPKHDICLSVGDLPLVLGMKNNATPPPPLPLRVNKDLYEQIKRTLAAFGPPPYIGLTWRAGEDRKRVLFKTVDIPALGQALKNTPARFISLQRHPDSGEMDALQNAIGAPILDQSHLNNDLPSMLALLQLLNDYIGVSNTNMHLRAGIGKPARVLVPHPPEWRWGLSGNTSPWFPQFRVYRQDVSGSWYTALDQLHWDLN
ncbi:MAG: tetratricopeptide repeat protein [Gammaproteobacteria bacterium]|nr:tetratricopeptide repeat protein [Gammaproteobacteria bacterium]